VDYVNSEDKLHRAASQEISSPLFIFHTMGLRRFINSRNTIGDIGDRKHTPQNVPLSPLFTYFTYVKKPINKGDRWFYTHGVWLIPTVHRLKPQVPACALFGVK
jgi:hypothetical protein